MRETSDLPSSAVFLLRIAAGIVVVEATVFIILAILDVADISSGRLGLGITAGFFLAVYGIGQLIAAVMLARGKVAARGPVLFTQLIQLGLAWNLRSAEQRWLPVVIFVSAAIVLACLLSRPVTRALSDEDEV